MNRSICIKALIKWHGRVSVIVIELLCLISWGVPVSEGCLIFNAVWSLIWCKCVVIRMNSCVVLNQWICTQGVYPLDIKWDEIAVLGSINVCHLSCPFLGLFSIFVTRWMYCLRWIFYGIFQLSIYWTPQKGIYTTFKHTINIPRLVCGDSIIWCDEFFFVCVIK